MRHLFKPLQCIYFDRLRASLDHDGLQRRGDGFDINDRLAFRLYVICVKDGTLILVIIAPMPLFYSRDGDDGMSGLLGEERLPKYHLRMETLGTLDEASAALGLARSLCRASQSAPLLLEAQRDLYRMMAEVAAEPGNADRFQAIGAERVVWLEQMTDTLATTVNVPAEFIIPGDTPASAALSLARTVIRRAERRVAELFDKREITNPESLRYLNRLSSLCFALELLENQVAGRSTTQAKE